MLKSASFYFFVVGPGLVVMGGDAYSRDLGPTVTWLFGCLQQCTIFKVLGKCLRVHLVFGKILISCGKNQLDKSFIVLDGQIF